MMMSLTAQAGRAVLKTQDWGGRVIDEKGEPMPYVNVVLLSLPDSAFVQGAMTDMDGVFKIVTDVNDGLFKVTSVGYQTLYINVGEGLTIQMKEDTQLLKEVVVKGQLPKTHVKGDAMRTTVAGTILEKAGTVSDALSKIPSLEAERDAAVKVLGRGEAEVYINGRKVQDVKELPRLWRLVPHCHTLHTSGQGAVLALLSQGHRAPQLLLPHQFDGLHQPLHLPERQPLPATHLYAQPLAQRSL